MRAKVHYSLILCNGFDLFNVKPVLLHIVGVYVRPTFLAFHTKQSRISALRNEPIEHDHDLKGAQHTHGANPWLLKNAYSPPKKIFATSPRISAFLNGKKTDQIIFVFSSCPV